VIRGSLGDRDKMIIVSARAFRDIDRMRVKKKRRVFTRISFVWQGINKNEQLAWKNYCFNWFW
jgi:hypothetical protein